MSQGRGMLKGKKRDYFRKLLNGQLDGLLGKNSHTAGSVADPTEKSQDFTDQATQESDMDFNIHMKERDSKMVVKIKEALERIEDGTYGICEECGQTISEERLKVRPVTTMCIMCKRKQENDEKLRGL